MSAPSQSKHAPGVQSLYAEVLHGRDAILPYAPLLEQLAGDFGQLGAMNWLDYFMSGVPIRIKSPLLVMLLNPGSRLGRLQRDSIFGCAFFLEYTIFGRSMGVIISDDDSGFRTVLSPAGCRSLVAERCAAELLNRGARLVLVSYGGTPLPDGHVPQAQAPAMWTSRTRQVGAYLELSPTYPETLARFSKSVRYRLRYYRRRLLHTIPCTFVPDATSHLSEAQFLALNRSSLNVIPDEEAALRWRACRLPGGYAQGLRTDDGRWLSMIGGWRQGDTTVVHWQQNSAGWEKYSLTNVLRSYFLEHETDRHTTRIVFFGGTPHGIGRYFVQRDVTDLIMRRNTLLVRGFMRLAVIFASRKWPSRHPNFLAETLGDNSLCWRPTAPALRRRGTSVAFSRGASPQAIGREGVRPCPLSADH